MGYSEARERFDFLQQEILLLRALGLDAKRQMEVIRRGEANFHEAFVSLLCQEPDPWERVAMARDLLRPGLGNIGLPRSLARVGIHPLTLIWNRDWNDRRAKTWARFFRISLEGWYLVGPLRIGGWFHERWPREVKPFGLELPEGLPLKLDMEVNWTQGRALPKGLNLLGGLKVQWNAGDGLLPDGLQVRGSARIFGCPDLTSFGNGIRIGGDLVVERCPQLLSLPEDLQVGGQLVLRDVPRLGSLPGQFPQWKRISEG